MFCHMINYLSMKIFWSTSSIPIVYQKYIWGRFRSRHINHRILLWQLMFIEIIMLQFLYQFTLPKSVKPCMKKCILSSIKKVVNVIIFYEIKRILHLSDHPKLISFPVWIIPDRILRKMRNLIVSLEMCHVNDSVQVKYI